MVAVHITKLWLDLAASLDDSSGLALRFLRIQVLAPDWDGTQWTDADAYATMVLFCAGALLPKLVRAIGDFLRSLGKHGDRPLSARCWQSKRKAFYSTRNLITWKKGAYGKSHDYLFCRGGIAWYSVSKGQNRGNSASALLTEKRGGWRGFSAVPAKSEFKRVSNVWDDIPELMRTEARSAELSSCAGS